MIEAKHWLEQHPYLEPIAQLQQAIEQALGGFSSSPVPEPPWSSYAADYQKGVPLLRSEAWQVDLSGAVKALVTLVAKVTATPLPVKLGSECHALERQLQQSAASPTLAMEWVLANGTDHEAPAAAGGLLKCLGWAAACQLLHPVIDTFARWREDRPWLHEYCPTCGALPVLARLVSQESGRRRCLICACCGTSWSYKRIGCPYCGNEDPRLLDILELEGEAGIRLDICQECKGYWKTITDEQNQSFFLTEWPLLHLDVVAQEHGFARKGTSRYHL